MKRLFILSIVYLATGLCFAGATVYVDDNAPNDPGPGNPLISDPAEDGSTAHPYDSIQQAIDSSDPNFVSDVIILPGTYTGTGNRDIDFKGKPITVRGTNPDDPNTVAATVIDCQGTQAAPHRGFNFHTNESNAAVLKGITVTNGYAESGGAIRCDNAHPSIIGCILRGNGAANRDRQYGGGIACYRSHAMVLDCEIVNNQGGGIFCYDESNPRISECFIAYNTARGGAGIFAYSGFPVIDGCVITSNEATIGGGGISCAPWGGATIRRCEITGNRGGGLECTGPTSLINCTIAGNMSSGNGGGLGCYETIVELSNCTIAGNRASTDGGGIFGTVGYPFGASVRLKNCIVYGNEAARGKQISFGTAHEIEFGGLQAWYSDIEGGIAEVFEGSGVIRFYEGTIDADPLFANPGRWDDNGTPADTSDDKWINGDYHLKSYAGRWAPPQEEWVMDSVHSPCIDAGDPTSDFSAEPAYNGGRVNMGAYGNTAFGSKTPNCPQTPMGDLNNDCMVTFADLALFAASWLDCNLDPPIACE